MVVLAFRIDSIVIRKRLDDLRLPTDLPPLAPARCPDDEPIFYTGDPTDEPTDPLDEVVAALHDRIPFVLPSETCARWLDPAQPPVAVDPTSRAA